MAEFKHLVVAKFKEGVVVEDIIKGMKDLVSDIDAVRSFEWGQDLESHEMLRQGFTHSFLMAFNNKEEYTAFLAHPKHVEFSATFSVAIDKVILLDFPIVLAKPIKPSETTAAEPSA
ncbi:stress-response A/B barrel domain-containing protein At5g22580-like [Chenopodium quinoa]|uniref:Stress-response A/B barrel domain-containing protein n=1 Tax=Chenopodium quinoa TaxID=63459 RepID=A0A803M650_CHEQI|nr:stress-response A/B barrel domain-containing protein At5g22580-like [Chenopodium quinoa]